MALLLFLIIPLLLITGQSYITNKQANEEHVRATMKGIIGILANDLSKTANDVTYTVNQYSSTQTNGLFLDLRALRDIRGFERFEQYQRYTFLNETAAQQIGRLSLMQAKVFYINRANYPLIGSISPEEVTRLQADERFGHLAEAEASTGLARWFRADRLSDSGAPYHLFLKKTVYDPFRGEVLGTLFVGIPNTYFEGLLRDASDGIYTLYESDGTLLAGMAGSPGLLTDGPPKGWMRESTGVPGTSWTLTYDLEVSRAIGDLAQRFWYTIMAVSIVLFIFLFMSSVIAQGLNRPIRKLMRVASEYGEGNSSIRYSVRGHDEISQLGGSINRMLDNIDALIRKVEAEQEEKRTIELYALFSQIQPHFLLNTLNSIKCNLAIEGDRSNSETIDALMGLLRAHLRVHEPSTLADECRLLKQYVSIMRMRNRLAIELEVVLPDRYQQLEVPRLLLQPLVENSIIHGFNQSSPAPHIRVEAAAAAGGIEIRVADNGRGLTAEQADALRRTLEHGAEQNGGRGVGLFNVLRRAKLSFGEHAALQVEGGEAGGVIARLFIPMEDHDGGEGTS